MVEWIIKNQFGRRNLQPYDRSRLALRLEEVYRARAKANQGTRTDILPTLAKSETINTRAEIAKIAGVTGSKLSRSITGIPGISTG